MCILSETIYMILIMSIFCTNDQKELHYRGISITWRRLSSSKPDEIRLEIIITLALSDKSVSLCDFHHPKSHEISSDFGIECIDSWDNCLSWPFKTLFIECHSKSHEYPKSLIFNEINILVPSGIISKNIYYKIKFPSSNNSCCWESFDSFTQPVQLESTLNFLEINQINSPPITRFPEHIYIEIPQQEFIYSLEIFDPDGDLFECSLLSSINFFTIDEHCQLHLKSSISIIEYIIIIQIEIIEYLNKEKNQIRSRLPYHFIGFIDLNNQTTIKCDKPPLIKLKNIENIEIHVLLNEIIQINLIASSQCEVEMDECLINSPFHWRIKSHIEKTIHNDYKSEIEYEFEWIPKTIQQCGFQIHCIRCLDQLTNYNDKCIHIFVNGPTCQNLNQIKKICSWSSFSIWSKYNQTIYKRTRICHETSNSSNLCSFCYGSSIQFQSSLAFLKDFELFEETLLSPTRAYSTMKIILIASLISSFIFLISIFISIYYSIKNIFKYKK